LQQVSNLKGSKTKKEIVTHYGKSCNRQIKDFIHDKAFIFHARGEGINVRRGIQSGCASAAITIDIRNDFEGNSRLHMCSSKSQAVSSFIY